MLYVRYLIQTIIRQETFSNINACQYWKLAVIIHHRFVALGINQAIVSCKHITAQTGREHLLDMPNRYATLSNFPVIVIVPLDIGPLIHSLRGRTGHHPQCGVWKRPNVTVCDVGEQLQLSKPCGWAARRATLFLLTGLRPGGPIMSRCCWERHARIVRSNRFWLCWFWPMPNEHLETEPSKIQLQLEVVDSGRESCQRMQVKALKHAHGRKVSGQ